MPSKIGTDEYLSRREPLENVQITSTAVPPIEINDSKPHDMWIETGAPTIAELAKSRALEVAHSNPSLSSKQEKNVWASTLESSISLPDIKEDLDNVSKIPGSTESVSSGSEDGPPRKPGMSQIHEITFIMIVCLAQFLSLSGMNQTVAPVMILAEYFNISDYGTLSWFSAAYSMTVGTFILPAGKPHHI
jgi:hypothetical protein